MAVRTKAQLATDIAGLATGGGNTVAQVRGVFTNLVDSASLNLLEAHMLFNANNVHDIGSDAERARAIYTQTLFVAGEEIQSLAKPPADRLAGFDFSADSVAYFTTGTFLSITGTTLNVTGVEPANSDILKADESDTLTVGFNSTDFDAGTQTTGTFTPNPASGNFQRVINGGAHTLAPPTTSCSIVVQYTNNVSAGAITTSGFTQVTGDAFDTTDGNDFMCVITRCNGFSVLNVTALQ